MCTVQRLFLTAMLLCSTPHVHALDIIWEPLSASTHPGNPADTFNEEPPGFDPASASLLDILQEVEQEFEAAFGDAATIRITYWWDVDMNLGGQSIPSWIEENPIGTLTHSVVRFNSTGAYYIDPTPENDSEYAMSQVLYNSGPNPLSPANQAARFTGSVPVQFEAGYNGVPVPGGPAVGQGTDLLTLAFQEVGHSLGMNAGFTGVTNGALTGEVDDGDYDVDINWVGGNVMDMLPRGVAPDPLDHLVGNDAVMGSLSGNERTRPSAADFFAIALTENWTNIYLPRREYLGGVIFNDPTAWIGGKTPNFTSDGFVRGSGGIAVAQTSMQFQNLSVFDAWNVTALQTNVLLDVAGTTTIDGSNTTNGSTKIVLQGSSSPGSLLKSNDLLLVSGGRLELDGQIPFAAARVDQTLDIDPTSSIFGHGFVSIVNDVVTDVLNNHGLIEADNGELRLAATNTINPVFDLDGDDPLNIGNVRAVTGDFSVFGLHVGDFSGLLRVGGGHRATFEHRFIVSADGLVLLDGNLTDPATVSGADLVLRGDVTVDKLGRVGKGSSDLATFESPVHVSVPQSDDELRLEGPAVFKGGLYDGAGTIRQDEDITVETSTQIDTATYDWGNSVPLTSNDTTVETGATFTINSPTTGTPDNEYRGVILVKNGVLEVNTSLGWTLPPEEEVAGVSRVPKGTLILQDRKSGSNMPIVRGQAITLGGLLLTLGGPGAVESDLFTETTGEIDVRNGTELLLKGVTTYDGGNIHGAGTLRQNGNAVVVGNTTIATTILDWDGAEAAPSNTTIQPGALLQINSSQIDDAPGSDGYDGHVTISDTAALVVFTSAPWRMEGLMTMQGQLIASPDAIVDGVTMVNAGRVEGNGWFQMSVENEGTIAPGQSAGAIRFEQDLTLSAGSVLEYEIGGITPITQFDQIGVGGTATLIGKIEVQLIGNFQPSVGDTFQVLTATSVINTFDQIVTSDASNMFDFDVTAIYSAMDVVLRIDDVFLSADFDHDDEVDGADFLIWQAGLGLTMEVDNTNGDANGDGIVDDADLSIWESQYGSMFSPLVAAAVVPEPSGYVLLILGTIGLLRRRCQHRLDRSPSAFRQSRHE